MGRNNIERSHLFMYVRSKLDPIADKVFAALLPGGEIQAGLYLSNGLNGGRGHGCVTDLVSGIGYDLREQICWGDYIDLGRQIWHYSAEKSAINLMEMFGLKLGDFEKELDSKNKERLKNEIPERELIFPLPPVIPQLPKVFPVLGKSLEIWPYHDAKGQLLFYVAYFPAYSGKVKRAYVSLFRNIDGSLQWYAGSSQPAYQLYNQPKINACSPITPVVVVRRESHVHLVENLYPEVVGTTWSPGLRKLDIQLLKEKYVVIWPEVSLNGCAAARILSEKLAAIGVLHSILNTIETLPEGWDLSSPLPEGVSYQDIYKGTKWLLREQFSHLSNKRYPTLQRMIHSLGFRDVEYL